jgi:putative DNA-invertase from lambdoid prophage Rac
MSYTGFKLNTFGAADMTIFAYLRVSTADKGQTTDNQKKLLVDAGFAIDQFVSEDGVSGSKKAFERPAFSKMLAKMVAGDTMMVTAVDRLGRSASDVLNVIEELKTRGIKVRVTQFDSVDITSPMGKMIITCMAAMAEMEKNLLIERTKAGMARTKEQGTKLGRSLTIHPTVLSGMIQKKDGGWTLDQIAELYKVPRNTIHRNLKTWTGKVAEYEVEWNAREQQYAAKAA